MEAGEQVAARQTGRGWQLIAPVLVLLTREGRSWGGRQERCRGLFSQPFAGDRVGDASSLVFTQHQAPSEAFREKCCHRNKTAVQIVRGRPAAMVAGGGTGAGRAAAGGPGRQRGAVPGWRMPCPPSSAPSSPVRAAVVLPCQRGRCQPQVASPPQIHWWVNAETTPAGKLPATRVPRGQAWRCRGQWGSWDRVAWQPPPIPHLSGPWHHLHCWRASLRCLRARTSSKAAPACPEPPTPKGPASLPRRGFKTDHPQ